MSGRFFLIPKRAFALFIVVIPPLGCMGIVLASWVLPLVMAVGRNGFQGIESIPVEWYGFAHAPSWIDPKADHDVYSIVDLCGLVLAVPGAWLFGTLGVRLWRFLVVTKLHWMTDEEVLAFEERTKRAPL